MNLSTEQCIQVAEKVWGWEQLTGNKPLENGCTVWAKREDQLACYELNIADKVHSWGGFGLTVEAMAKANRIIQINEALIVFTCADSMCMKKEHQGKAWFNEIEEDYSRQVIEATHLAALEALKDG